MNVQPSRPSCIRIGSDRSPRCPQATRLWEARVAAGISLRELAAMLGVTPQVYSRLEHAPEPDLALIAKALEAISRKVAARG